jgi:hypothetical protein
MSVTIRRWLLVILAIIIVTVAIGIWLLYEKTFTLVLRQEEIQKALDARFPIGKPVYKLNQADLKQSLAKLLLKDVKVRNRTLVVTMGIGPQPAVSRLRTIRGRSATGMIHRDVD